MLLIWGQWSCTCTDSLFPLMNQSKHARPDLEGDSLEGTWCQAMRLELQSWTVFSTHRIWTGPDHRPQGKQKVSAQVHLLLSRWPRAFCVSGFSFPKGSTIVLKACLPLRQYWISFTLSFRFNVINSSDNRTQLQTVCVCLCTCVCARASLCVD